MEDLKYLIAEMERMAGAPAERHVRQPGEKGAYERYSRLGTPVYEELREEEENREDTI